ncbi:MAG: hypothetical protein IJU01_00510 [Lachnospiraceae bacterium]|nr:hypothetical protein [Lachnospiraceae bacterium]
MLTGVKIDDIDTMDRWGLILLDDVKIDAPKQKTSKVDVPAADGSLDLSYALTDGEPVFEDREISFTLFTWGAELIGNPDGDGDAWSLDEVGRRGNPADDENYELISSSLFAFLHGRQHKLWLPDDDTHYYKGVFSAGQKAHKSGRIPVSGIVHPYKFKNEVTEASVTIGSSGTELIILYNEQKAVIPDITSSGAATLYWNASSATLTAGKNRISDLKLKAGETVIRIKAAEGTTVTFTYQEKRF